MRSSITFGKLFGIPVGVHYSWFLVFILIAWSLAAGYFPQEHPGWSQAGYWTAGLITGILFFVSVLIHELSHSIVALRDGVPVSGITLFIFGGLAQLRREPPTAGSEFRIAIAGPIASAGLALLFFLLGTLPFGPFLGAVSSYLARINLMLALFNLIPGFPLDGGRVLRSILWKTAGSFRRATRWASMVGQGVALLFILGGIALAFSGSILNGLWIAFIGWFLNNAAESSYQQVVMRDILSSVKAGEVMNEDCPQVPAGISLERLVQDNVLTSGRRCFFIFDGSRLQGMITLHQVKDVPKEQWPEVTVAQAMTPAREILSARPQQDVWTLLQKMDEKDVNQVPVMENGSLMGVVSRDRLLRYIRLRNELDV